jgi:hypothetical protein
MRTCQIWMFVLLTGLLPVLFPTHSGAAESNCEAQGIDTEREFARRVCAAAEDLGLDPTLVHSFGAGGVDVFVSQSVEGDLRADPTKLRRLMVKLTDWVKQNYVGFNAVEVTLVGDSKIAKGSKVGTMEMKVILF